MCNSIRDIMLYKKNCLAWSWHADYLEIASSLPLIFLRNLPYSPYSDFNLCHSIWKENFLFFFNFQQSRRKQIFWKRTAYSHRDICLSSTQCSGRTWTFLTVLFSGKCHLAVPFTNERNGAKCLHSKGKPRRMQSGGKCAWAAAAFHPGGGVGVLWQQLTG